MDPPLVIEDLWKRYGRTTALQGVSFSVGGPGLYVLFGPNGSGKSTLIRIVLGISRPSRGRVLVYGLEPYRKPGAISGIVAAAIEGSWVPPYLPGRLLAETLSIERGIPFSVIEKYATELGITAYWDRLSYTYSMGMRKRLLLALAFASAEHARMLVLDEPYTLLDQESLRRASSIIAGIASRIPVIVATHILTEAESRASEVIILESGRVARILKRGEEEIYKCPLELEEEARVLAKRFGGRLIIDYSRGELVVYGVPQAPGEACEGMLSVKEA